MSALLEVDALHVELPGRTHPVTVVDEISYAV